MNFIKIVFVLISALRLLSAQAETVTYYVNDLVGSPVAAMDSAGAVIWRESYNPFGEGRNKPSQNTNDVGYTGHQKDDATGLTYMQARYYDPTIGRFYGVDPVKYTLDNPIMSFNRYTYANNNPYRYTDPDGRFIFIAITVASIAYSAYSGYQQNGTKGALAEASGYNDAIDSYNSLKSGDFSGAVVAAAGIVCKSCKAANKIKQNIKRFKKKLPSNAKDSIVQKNLPSGGIAVQGTSKGKVPGSKAVYEKQIDSNGDTLSYTKTTYGPNGKIIHVKDKISGDVIKNER